MPVFHKYKAVQTHIPKTAGTTVSHILGLNRETCKSLDDQREWLFGELGVREFGLPYQHITCEDIKQRLSKKIYNEYFKFSFIRNPWDRLVSELLWINSFRTRSPHGTTVSLEGLIDSLKENKPLRMRSQVDYLQDKNGKLLVDFLGRFENLAEDWIEIAFILGAPLYILDQKLNTSLGFLINNTKETLFLQEDNGPILTLLPNKKIQTFKRRNLEKEPKSYAMKYSRSLRLLKDGNYEGVAKISKESIRKFEKIGIPYYHAIHCRQTPLMEFYCDERLNCEYTSHVGQSDEIAFELKNLNIDIFKFNKADRKNYKEYYNSKTKKAVGELYEEDVDTFKYTF